MLITTESLIVCRCRPTRHSTQSKADRAWSFRVDIFVENTGPPNKLEGSKAISVVFSGDKDLLRQPYLLRYSVYLNR